MSRSKSELLSEIARNNLTFEQASFEVLCDLRDMIAIMPWFTNSGLIREDCGFAQSVVKSPTLNECKDVGVISETKTEDNLAVPEVNRPNKLIRKSNKTIQPP